MRGKILFGTGLAVGYILGTRAGRERYEQIKRAADRFWGDPHIQKRVDQVEGYVRDKAPEVAEFVSDGAKKVVSAVITRGDSTKKSSGASSTSSSSATSSTAKKPAARKPAAKKPAAKKSS